VSRARESHLRRVDDLTVVPVTVEFRELRYFTVLCEELHFGRAAERLHISQSPLSQSIAQLERKLGTRLLDRSSRYVRLTPAGEVLLAHSRRLLHELEDAIGATQRAGAGERGLLRVAVGPIARETILPALRHELDERLPDLVLEVVEDMGDGMVEGLLSGASDLVVMLCPPAHADVERKPIRREKPIAVVHHDHPLADRDSVGLDELAKYTLVVSPRPFAKGAHDVVLAMFHGHPPAATRIADLNSGPFWDAMLAQGFAVLPHSAPFSGDFVALPIADVDAEFEICMVWSKQTAPAILPGLIKAADAAIAANAWL
jgi:DNA-binding transcriptional LysR family regulator